MTGPAAAGKTSTALLWSVTRERPTFALDCDLARSVMLIADQLHGRALDSNDVAAQYDSAAKVAAEWAAQVTAAGVDAVVVGGRLPNPPFEAWRHSWDDLDRLDPITVVLHPRVDVCVTRNASDSARRGEFAVAEEHVRFTHALAWDEWKGRRQAVVLDTSEMTHHQVVAAVEDAVVGLERRPRTGP
jgi:hypothetical protein